jgi:hypothetical protein
MIKKIELIKLFDKYFEIIIIFPQLSKISYFIHSYLFLKIIYGISGLIQLHYRGLNKAGKEFKLRCVMHDLRKLLKVFVNNSQARDEITHMGEYPSQAAV